MRTVRASLFSSTASLPSQVFSDDLTVFSEHPAAASFERALARAIDAVCSPSGSNR